MHPVILYKNQKVTDTYKSPGAEWKLTKSQKKKEKNHGKLESFCVCWVTLHMIGILSLHQQLWPFSKIHCCSVYLVETMFVELSQNRKTRNMGPPWGFGKAKIESKDQCQNW